MALVISNAEPWEATGQKHIILKITMRKWPWISHAPRKRGEYIDKRSIGLESAGNRKERKPKQNWKKTGLEEAGKRGKNVE
jgi:hypothetical protein